MAFNKLWQILGKENKKRLILKESKEALQDKRLKFIQVEVDEYNLTAMEITHHLTNLGFSDPVMRHPPYFAYYYKPYFNYIIFLESKIVIEKIDGFYS